MERAEKLAINKKGSNLDPVPAVGAEYCLQSGKQERTKIVLAERTASYSRVYFYPPFKQFKLKKSKISLP